MSIKTWLYWKKDRIFLLSITGLSALLTFINYPNRWGLAADQARDVLVVRHALALHTLPLIGPYSASGPFVFGPFWYWIFMIPIGLFPKILLAPWIFQSLLYVSIVPLFYCIGKKLQNNNFGLLLALFAAISPAYITIATNLIMSAIVGIMGVGILYFFIDYLQTKQIFSLISLSFLIGLAMNTHFEAAPLGLLLPAAWFLGEKNHKHILAMCFPFLLPFLPLIIFTFQYHGYEITNIIHTLFTPHAGAHLNPFFEFFKHWATFLIIFLPKVWQQAVGGNTPFAFLVMAFCLFTFVYAIYKREIQKNIAVLFIIFFVMSALFGYYNGTLFEQFFTFALPFLFIFTTWACLYVINKQKVIGITLTALIVLFSLISDMGNITSSTNKTAQTAFYWTTQLDKIQHANAYKVYNFGTLNKNEGLALSMLLSYQEKSSQKGIELGVGYVGAPIGYPILINGPADLRIYTLGNTPDERLKKEGFTAENATNVYDSVENWWK